MSKSWSWAFLFGLIFMMMGTFIATLGMDGQDMIMSVLAIGVILMSLAAERIYPFCDKWRGNQGDVGGDIASLVIIFAVLDSIFKWATPFILLALIGDSGATGFAIPLWLEVIAVGLIIELGAYVSHRLHHKVRWLWPLHAMHHSPERLYTLNNFRFHPLNHLINHILAIMPAVLIGFSPQAVLGYTAFALPILLTQHANVDFRFGWLNYILNTNEVHRWHHSVLEQEGNRNYGRATVLWDHLFGSFHLPNDRRAPEEVGLFVGGLYFPAARRFIAQLAYPFTTGCCKAAI